MSKVATLRRGRGAWRAASGSTPDVVLLPRCRRNLRIRPRAGCPLCRITGLWGDLRSSSIKSHRQIPRHDAISGGTNRFCSSSGRVPAYVRLLRRRKITDPRLDGGLVHAVLPPEPHTPSLL